MENTKPVKVLNKEEQFPRYEPPKVITLNKDEILEELGPAQAIYGGTPESGICS